MEFQTRTEVYPQKSRCAAVRPVDRIGNKKQLKSKVLPALIEWWKGKTGLPFNTEASINLADDEELMRLMVEAGFDTVFVGIETPNEDSLAECSKTQNKGRDLVESVKGLQRAGL